MDKKLSLIIAIALVLIIIGGYLIITNQPHGDVSGDSFKIPLKNQDFEFFSIYTPEGSNFTVQNQAEGIMSYQNTGNYSDDFSRLIINKNLTESLIGDNSQSVLNTSTEQIYSTVFKNETVYKYVSVHDDADVILIGNDLNLLKEIGNSVKIKDVTNL